MFLGKIVHHCNRLMVRDIGMKLSTHTYYITPMTLNWFPWQPPTINSLWKLSIKSLLHFSDLQTIAHIMVMILTGYMYFVVSMATINIKMASGTFPYKYFFISQTCKQCCMEVKLGTRKYFCTSMTTIEKKLPRALFPVITSSVLKPAHHAMHGDET